jgi:hypothetical protein
MIQRLNNIIISLLSRLKKKKRNEFIKLEFEGMLLGILVVKTFLTHEKYLRDFVEMHHLMQHDYHEWFQGCFSFVKYPCLSFPE